MKKSSLAVFAFALLAAAAPFAALLVPPAAPTPPTDSVQADDLSPAATPQPLPTMPPSNAQNGTTIPNAALAAADITLYDADTGCLLMENFTIAIALMDANGISIGS